MILPNLQYQRVYQINDTKKVTILNYIRKFTILTILEYTGKTKDH